MITIIDYKRGNLASVRRGLTDAGYEVRVSDQVTDILSAEALLLPGVGAFDDAMGILEASGQADAIRQRVAEGVPFLGICLGQQLIFEWGEEGAEGGSRVKGLGLVPGGVVKMPAQAPDGTMVKIPHVGWNSVELVGENPLFEGIPQDSYFYFTHSYVAVPSNAEDIAGITVHAQPFCSAVHHGNVFATQFHPEKSSTLGLAVLANFGKLVEGLK
jgi:glutamine amidotransferase